MEIIRTRKYWYGQTRALQDGGGWDLVDDGDGWWAWGVWDTHANFDLDPEGERLRLHKRNGTMYLGDFRVLSNGDLYNPDKTASH